MAVLDLVEKSIEDVLRVRSRIFRREFANLFPHLSPPRKSERYNMHPHRAKAKASHAAKIKGYATGGRVGSSDISEPKVKMMQGTEGEGKAFGGPTIGGMKAKSRPHMKAPKKGGTHVNVVVMPHGGGAGPAGPGPMPMPGPGPMIPPPVRPVAPAPMPGPMGMPPMGGPPPMMRKRGGRVRGYDEGGSVDSDDDASFASQMMGLMGQRRKNVAPSEGRKHGGKIHKASGGRVSGKVDHVSRANPLRKPTGSADPVSKAEPLAKSKGIVKGLKSSSSSHEANPNPVSKAEPTAKMKPLGMEAGSTNGVAGLQKISKYGRNVGKPAKSSSTS